MGGAGLKQEIVHRIVGASFGQPSDFPALVSRQVSRNRRLRSVDRRELMEFLYGFIRWRRRIWGDIAPTTLVIDDSQKRLQEAQALRGQPPLSRWAGLSMDSLARELSFPTWIIEEWVRQFGFSSTVSLALSLNEPAPVTLRVNTLKTDREEMIRALKKEKVEATVGIHSPWAIRVAGRRNLRSLQAFKRGWFELQDEASQMACLASEVRPLQFVIDACAGAGGKSLALAAMMKNEGKLLAADSDSRVFTELRKRAKRAGAKVIDTTWVAADDPKPLAQFEEKANLVFVDAPCSGLGILRRDPWARWSLSAAKADGFPAKQSALLARYSRWVKPGGKLVYATCTIRAAENEDVIGKFVSAESAFELVGTSRQLRPDVEGTDGFFFSVLERKNR